MAKKVVKGNGDAAKPAGKKAAKGGGEDMVSLKDLAKEAKITPVAARVKLRNAEIEREGRWAFKDGSSSLKAARKALGL